MVTSTWVTYKYGKKQKQRKCCKYVIHPVRSSETCAGVESLKLKAYYVAQG